MKRTLSAIAAIFLSTYAFAHVRTALGTDLMPLLEKGHIRFQAGHGFNERWSASFSAELDARIYPRVTDAEYKDHLYEFGEGPEEVSENDGCFRMSVCYWTKETYKGMFLGVGCRCSFNESPDCFLDIGYAIHIWKGLTMIFSYGTDLIATSRSGRHIGQGAGIGLYWTINDKRRR